MADGGRHGLCRPGVLVTRPAAGVSSVDRRRLLVAAGVGVLAATSARAEVAQEIASPLGPLPDAWGRAQTLPLWPDGAPETGFKATPPPADFPPGFFRNVAEPFLKVFRPARPNGRAILVTPGGAYAFVVGTHEGAATAQAFAELGYVVFVLIYRLPGEGWSERWNVPLQDAQRAMRLVRFHAAEFGVLEDRVSVLGYSAGGHLAATLGTDFDARVYTPRDAVDERQARPSAMGLIYPVITLAAPLTNPQTALSLLGDDPPEDRVLLRSPQRHVDAQTPPTFLVHALDDAAVPPENALMMLEACRGAGVKVEAHLFQNGEHGFGLGQSGTPAGRWPGLFHGWLDRLFAPVD